MIVQLLVNMSGGLHEPRFPSKAILSAILVHPKDADTSSATSGRQRHNAWAHHQPLRGLQRHDFMLFLHRFVGLLFLRSRLSRAHCCSIAWLRLCQLSDLILRLNLLRLCPATLPMPFWNVSCAGKVNELLKVLLPLTQNLGLLDPSVGLCD